MSDSQTLLGPALERLRIVLATAGERSAEPAGFAAMVEDVAAAFEELQVSREELRVLSEELSAAHEAAATAEGRYWFRFEEAPDAYVVTDPLGVILEHNRAARELLGDRGRVSGRTLAMLVAAEERRSLRTELNLLRRDHTPRTWTLPFQPSGGRAVVATARVSAIVGADGEVRELCWIIRPVDPLTPRTPRTATPVERTHTAGTQPLVELVETACQVAASIDDLDGAIVQLGRGGEAPFLATRGPNAATVADADRRCGGPLTRAVQSADRVLHDVDPGPQASPFDQQVAPLGVRRVVAVPITSDDGLCGVLALCGGAVEIGAADVTGAESLAELVGRYVEVEEERLSAQHIKDQLQHALDSRVVIEQAKGRLMEASGLPVDEAFDRLRQHARSHNRCLSEVANDVVADRLRL